MSIKNYLLIFILLSFVASCKNYRENETVSNSNSEPDTLQNKVEVQAPISNKLDTVNVLKVTNPDDKNTQNNINKILAERNQQNANVQKLAPKSFKKDGFELNAFYDGNELAKIVKVIPVADKKNFFTFYYKSGKMYYATSSTQESPSEFYYFENENMIRWNGIQGKSISKELPEFQQKQQELIAESRKMLELIQ